MNLIESSVKITEQGVNVEDVFNYMNELQTSKEHQTVYLCIPTNSPEYKKIMEYRKSPYIRIYKKTNNKSFIFVTMSYNYMIQEFGDLFEFFDYNNFSERRITFEINCNLHSACAFLINFKHFAIEQIDKYEDNIDFIRPYWIEEYKEDSEFGYSLYYTEQRYLELIKENVDRIDAGEVLPSAKNTTLYITGFVTEWVSVINNLLDHYEKYNKDNNMYKLLQDIQKELKKYITKNRLTLTGMPLGTTPA